MSTTRKRPYDVMDLVPLSGHLQDFGLYLYYQVRHRIYIDFEVEALSNDFKSRYTASMIGELHSCRASGGHRWLGRLEVTDG